MRVCNNCWLVQIGDHTQVDELFRSDYAYFSSTSATWLEHSRLFAATICRRLALDQGSFVVEIACNDGYMLKHFVAAGIPCLGIEPTAGTAAAAEKQNIPVLRRFFGEQLAIELVTQGKQADLIIANNVYAHVPDINDFTAGLKVALKPGGTVTLEFPHLLNMLKEVQFDTCYHEHFSYLSLYTVTRIFERAGLRVWDVEEIQTHGGSLRVFGCHLDDTRAGTDSIAQILALEASSGLKDLAIYEEFQSHAERAKNDLLSFLIEQKHSGRTVAAYGAAAKGNTLLNFGGIKPDLLPYVCDAALSKQGKYLPGSHIPILPPATLRERKPDRVIILPWNISEEVCRQNNFIREWGGKFVVAIPRIRILD